MKAPYQTYIFKQNPLWFQKKFLELECTFAGEKKKWNENDEQKVHTDTRQTHTLRCTN